jgi:hypothetical protein
MNPYFSQVWGPVSKESYSASGNIKHNVEVNNPTVDYFGTYKTLSSG